MMNYLLIRIDHESFFVERDYWLPLFKAECDRLAKGLGHPTVFDVNGRQCILRSASLGGLSIEIRLQEVAGVQYNPFLDQLQPTRTTGMNHTTAVFLINKDLRAILAEYEPGSAVKKIMFKTLDATIAKDDFVVVPTGTRHGMTVVKVTDVDVSVDFDDPTKVDWVIGKVDRAAYETTLKEEAQAIETIKSAEFRARRAKLFDELVADKDAIKALPIYKNGV